LFVHIYLFDPAFVFVKMNLCFQTVELVYLRICRRATCLFINSFIYNLCAGLDPTKLGLIQLSDSITVLTFVEERMLVHMC
jgi:hypothetical protein